MLGRLPQTLNVCGTEYRIRPDFRNVLTVIAAFNDEELTDKEKVFVCLNRIYEKFFLIPKDKDTVSAAFTAASQFIECRLSNDKPSPKVVNWEKDEQLIFPAINKVAGTEVRSLPFLHWWTFLGYFQSIDRDDLWGTVLTIRQKKAKGKKLEAHEKEFYASNRELCSMKTHDKRKTPEDEMQAIFNALLEEGGTENG